MVLFTKRKSFWGEIVLKLFNQAVPFSYSWAFIIQCSDTIINVDKEGQRTESGALRDSIAQTFVIIGLSGSGKTQVKN